MQIPTTSILFCWISIFFFQVWKTRNSTAMTTQNYSTLEHSYAKSSAWETERQRDRDRDREALMCQFQRMQQKCALWFLLPSCCALQKRPLLAQMNLSPNVQQSREKSKNPKEANTAPERDTHKHTHTFRASYITYMYTTYSQAPPPRLLQQMKTAGNQSKNSFTPKKFALSGQIQQSSIAANLLCKFQEKSMS